jgi:hypothetical protein
MRKDFARAVVGWSIVIILVFNPLATKYLYGLSNGWRIFPAFVDVYLSVLIALGVAYLRGKREPVFWVLLAFIVALLPASLAVELRLYHAFALESLEGSVGPEAAVQVDNVHVPDEKTGWTTVSSRVGRHRSSGNFDVEYSYAFGHGVSNEDTALTLLNERLGPSIQVLNYGVMGFGLEQIFLRFSNNEDQIHSRDMVVFAPSSADLYRNLEHPEYICFFRFEALQPVTVYPQFRHGQWTSVPLEEACDYVKDYLLFKSQLPFGLLWRMFRQIVSRGAPLRRTRETASTLLAEAQTRSQKRGARFELLLFAKPEECQQGRHDLDWGGLGIHFDSLIRYCPAGDEAIQALRFPGDGHLSVRGNRWAADALEDWLQGLRGAEASAG